MAPRKKHLQKNRMRAFNATLDALEPALEKRIKFIQDYAEVFKFPTRITRENLRKYNKWLRAVRSLKDIEHKKL